MFFRVAATAVAACALALTGSAVAQAAPASGVQLTGKQLAAELLPLSHFGAGYELQSGSTFNSGSKLEHPLVKVDQYTLSCKAWFTKAPQAGYGETGYASNAFNKFVGGSGENEGYQQSVYQFPSAAAAASYYRASYALTARCEKVTVTIDGKTASLTTQYLKTGHAGGHSAFFDLADTVFEGAPVTVNDTETVLAGQDVISIDAFAYRAPRPLTPNATTLALIARVDAAG